VRKFCSFSQRIICMIHNHSNMSVSLWRCGTIHKITVILLIFEHFFVVHIALDTMTSFKHLLLLFKQSSNECFGPRELNFVKMEINCWLWTCLQTRMHSLTPHGRELLSDNMIEDSMTWKFVAGLTVACEILELWLCRPHCFALD